MSPDVVVLADDLTGAGDTAVRFAGEGWTAELQLRPETTRSQVVAVTTDSRACTAEEAAGRVRAVAQPLVAGGVQHLYKKVDSTLRGPVRAEVEALLSVMAPGVVAVVCPAYPAVGRTLSGGTLLVHGRPVSETAAGTDPVTPVTQSHLPTLLDAPLVRLEPDAGTDAWAAAVRAGGPVVVVDAEDDEDLDRIARTVVALGGGAVAVGSAGLAGALARHWRPLAPTTALVVISSLHDAARGQAQALSDDGAVHHRPSVQQLLDDAGWAGFVEDVVASAHAHPEVLLVSAPDPGEHRVDPARVATRLAEVVVAVLERTDVAGMVVTGGDGARAVLAGVDASGIRLHGQVVPGVPFGELVGGWAAGLTIATKSGGFGDTDVLITAAEAVRENRRPS